MSEDPGKKSIKEFLENINNGSYVIPYFQRGFEWRPSMVCDLFESILQNYYSGIILLWELDIKQAKEEKWDPVWGAELKNNPVSAILDGQQRLSSIYFGIFNPKKLFPNRYSFYVFYIDLLKVLNEEFDQCITYYYYKFYRSWNDLLKEKNNWEITGKIPLSILSADTQNGTKKFIDSDDFEELIKNFLSKNKSKIPENINVFSIYKIFKGILDYQFVHFSLSSNRNLPDICNIFARVNEKGMKLNTFDLMNAFLFPKGIQLRKDLWENFEYILLKNIDPNMNEYLLKLISLIKQNYCSSKYIYNLVPGEKTKRRDETKKIYEEVLVKDSDDFVNLWKKSMLFSEEARKMIMNTGDDDFGAIKSEFIPNTTIIPVLGAILFEYKNNFKMKIDKRKFFEYLKLWYWTAVLSEDYSGSSDSVMAKDYRDWKEWMKNGKIIERINRINYDSIYEIDLKTVRKGSSRYNAIICLLALQDAKDFYKGRIVGTGDYINQNINDHHIFPSKIQGLSGEKSIEFKETKDCILNRTLLLNETNNSIKAKKPSIYIKDMIDKKGNKEEVQKILSSHMISKDGMNYLEQDMYDAFIKERENVIKKHILMILELG